MNRPTTRWCWRLLAVYFAFGVSAWWGIPSRTAVNARVGPGTLPGVWEQPAAEQRLGAVRWTLERFERVLEKGGSNSALDEVAAEQQRRLVDSSPAEFRRRLGEVRRSYDQLAEQGELDERAEHRDALTELERQTEGLFAPRIVKESLFAWVSTLLGTDRAGRSIALRTWYGLGLALQVGFLAASISALIGWLLGATAAWLGGWVDGAIQGASSILGALPSLVLLAVFAYAFHGSAVEGTWVPMTAALSLVFWVTPCRVVRAETLKLKELPFVQAGTVLGFSRLAILRKLLLPNTAHLAWSQFALLFVAAIKAEVILSFLGLGVRGAPSWGAMIRDSGSQVIDGFFWQLGAPTVALLGLVLTVDRLSHSQETAGGLRK